ncbi:MAG TPA: hypothetical protein VFK42_13565 [Acidimicrobiales bacterium]|jgi:predicted small secreted protein|nr:hypothetical protein [Acidimicrobiales bacterium]
MRRSRAGLVVGVVAAMALLVAACRGAGDDPAQIVRAAASKTEAADSSRLAVTVDVHQGPLQGAVTAEGEFDYGTRRGRMSMDVPRLGAMDAIADGSVLYMKFPAALAQQLPGGKSWVKLDVESAARQSGFDVSELAQVQQGDPTQALQYLRGASDDVKKVGEEELRGAHTTHYTATLDLKRAASSLSGARRTAYDKAIARLGSATLPADVWVDDAGRARKLSFTQDAADVTLELYDFGVDVDAPPPAASDVVDLAELLGGGAAG